MSIANISRRFGSLTLGKWRGFAANESGASIIIIGLAMPALIGAIGLAVEVSYWQLRHRAEQNQLATWAWDGTSIEFRPATSRAPFRPGARLPGY